MRVLLIIKYLILLITVTILLSACYYDTEEDLYGSSSCDTQDISFANDVQPLLMRNCYVCHDAANNFGNVTLEGYTNTKEYVDNGRLLGSITHTSGFAPMPNNGPKLLDCDIEKIQVWADAGAPNN